MGYCNTWAAPRERAPSSTCCLRLPQLLQPDAGSLAGGHGPESCYVTTLVVCLGTVSLRLVNTMTGGYALADHLTPPPLVGRQVSVDSTTTHADDDASAAITQHHTSEPGA